MRGGAVDRANAGFDPPGEPSVRGMLRLKTAAESPYSVLLAGATSASSPRARMIATSCRLEVPGGDGGDKLADPRRAGVLSAGDDGG
jgi:hypothetical protein